MIVRASNCIYVCVGRGRAVVSYLFSVSLATVCIFHPTMRFYSARSATKLSRFEIFMNEPSYIHERIIFRTKKYLSILHCDIFCYLFINFFYSSFCIFCSRTFALLYTIGYAVFVIYLT